MSTKTMKIATFKRLGDYSFDTVSDDALDGSEDFVRTSEYVEVSFPSLHSDEVVQRQLDALDRAEDALRTKFQAALTGIEVQRAELRAITLK